VKARLKTHVIIGGKLHEKGSVVSRELIPERFRDRCLSAEQKPVHNERSRGYGASAFEK
jgi:hypothetical protein